MARSPGETRDEAGLPAPVAAQRRCDIRMLVPGLLLMFSVPILMEVGWIRTGWCAWGVGAALIAASGFRGLDDAIRVMSHGNTLRMVVPGTLLTLAGLILAQVGWIRTGVFAR